jgi:hypothetical protein
MEDLTNDVPPPLTRRWHTDSMGEKNRMLMLPAVLLLGFLALTALVIAMGTQSTARYEREQRAVPAGGRPSLAEPAGAVRA